MQHSMINYSHYALNYILKTYLFYNWQSTFRPHSPISPTASLHLLQLQSVLCNYELTCCHCFVLFLDATHTWYRREIWELSIFSGWICFLQMVQPSWGF